MKILSLTLLLAASLFSQAPAPANSWRIDPLHSQANFTVRHMMISTVRGTFGGVRGTIIYDAKNPAASTVEATIDCTTLNTGEPKRDNDLKGEEFFDVKKYPRAVFKGSLQSPVGGVPTQLVGELTLHGVTRPLTLAVNSLKCIQHPMLKRDYCGADASGSFNRDDFGLGMGKEYGFKMNVDLRVQVEAIAQP